MTVTLTLLLIVFYPTLAGSKTTIVGRVTLFVEKGEKKCLLLRMIEVDIVLIF
jgi:hypothetical protein